jgi:translation initiation factor 3 subunit I
MRPILLQGHERSLTMVKYNRDGDLLFSCSKDPNPNVWYTHNGEMLGSYNGHDKAVWCLDVSGNSKLLITGSADSTAKLWEVETGKELFTFTQKTAVRSVGFSLGDREVLVVTDARMKFPAQLMIYEIAQDPKDQTDEPVSVMDVEGSKITVAVWGPLNKYIYCGHENGEVSIWDWKLGEKINSVNDHKAQIMDLQFSKEKAYFITASKDHTALLYDVHLKVLKRFLTDRPVNSASISPLKDHVLTGGGQEAMSVTTTAAKAGKFEVRIFHKILEEEIGRVKGHFGPINTIAFHPKGTGFASGGEDGYVRLHHFDDDYFEFKVEV